MKIIKGVYGSIEQTKSIIVNVDTVYIHSNIQKVEEIENLYQYDEIQYTKDEYIQLMANRQELQTQLLNLFAETFKTERTLTDEQNEFIKLLEELNNSR